MKKVIDIYQDSPQLLVFTDNISPELKFRIGGHSNLTIVQWITGNRNQNIDFDLIGPGSTVKYIGLFYGKADNSCFINTNQSHQTGGSTSSILVRSVLSEHSSLQFAGKIYVALKADGTDAYQRNDNLLLNDGAKVSSRPVLEICANDLKCTHGVTTGFVDPREIWMLQNRGIDGKRAIDMISAGYLIKAFENITPDSRIIEISRKINKIFGLERGI
jgi:Fe-S cluster assembly protein SufD